MSTSPTPSQRAELRAALEAAKVTPSELREALAASAGAVASFDQAHAHAERLGQLVAAHVASCSTCDTLHVRVIDPPMPNLCPAGTALWSEMATWVNRAQELL
jgi:multidrug resistance efflux pump